MKRLLTLIIITAMLTSFLPAASINAASRPNIIITSSATSPSSVVPDEQFTLAITLKNKGGAAAEDISVAVSGSNLNTIDSSNTDFVTSLAANGTTTVTFTLKSAGSTTSTRENLTVDLSYEDSSDTAYSSSQSVGITYSAKAGATKPRLLVASYSTSPAVIKSGQKFTLRLRVKNKGDSTAKNVVATATSTVAKVLSSSSKKYLSTIAAGGSKTTSFRMVADKTITSNLAEVTIELAYDDSADNTYTASQTVGLVTVPTKTAKAKKKTTTIDKFSPRVLIDSYNTNPFEIAPGERFGLEMTVKNMTSRAAKNIVVSVGSAASASDSSSSDSADSSKSTSSSTSSSSSESFAAVDSSNTRFISSLASGAKEKVYFNMMAGPNISAGLYNLTINLSYLDAANKKSTSSESIGLIIKRKPAVSIVLANKPDKVFVGEDYGFSFDVYNLSDFTVKGVIISALGEGITADINKDSKYLGTIESGDSETIEVNGNASISGYKNIILRIQYRDDFGQTQAIERPLKILVKEPSAKVKETSLNKKGAKSGKSFFGRMVDFFKALLGIG